MLRKTFRISTVEGLFAQIYGSIAAPGSIFITKFAVMLGATPFQFGLLSAIGQLSQIFQPLGAVITKNSTSRKSMVIKLAAAGRFLALFYGLTALILPYHAAIWVFLSFFLFSNILQAISGNAWIAWVSDIVPLKFRGRFFSWRSRYLLIAGLLTGYILGAFLDLFEPETNATLAWLKTYFQTEPWLTPDLLPAVFLTIFILAAIIGLIGLKFLGYQPELPKQAEQISNKDLFLAPFKDRNFRWLAVYVIWWMLVVGIGSPFWQPFMIQKLKMSLVNIQIYGTVSTVASLAVLKIWGSVIDRVGNKTAMRIAILMSGMNALTWVFVTPEFYWILYVEAATSGIMWAGAGIVATNFVLAVAPDEKRQIYSGVFGACSGAAMMMTMLISGMYLPSPMTIAWLHLEPEQVLFGLTGILRWTTLIPLMWVNEPRSSSMKLAFAYLFHISKSKMTQLTGRIVSHH